MSNNIVIIGEDGRYYLDNKKTRLIDQTEIDEDTAKKIIRKTDSKIEYQPLQLIKLTELEIYSIITDRVRLKRIKRTGTYINVYISDQNKFRRISISYNGESEYLKDMIHYSLIFASLHKYAVNITLLWDKNNNIRLKAEETNKDHKQSIIGRIYTGDKFPDFMGEIRKNLESGIVTTGLDCIENNSIHHQFFVEDTRVIAEKITYTQQYFKNLVKKYG